MEIRNTIIKVEFTSPGNLLMIQSCRISKMFFNICQIVK
ncbi:hypothetical protein IMSAGC008_02272 [Muribaculaceae bacterium]|nr:hypothetical protein IMSAGC008_02272 [Muribaculaceae bacterium]